MLYSTFLACLTPDGGLCENVAVNGARPKPVEVSSLLSEETILIAAPGTDKAALLTQTVERLCRVKGLDAAAMLAKVLERERGIATTLDTGLALPHARVDELPEIV